MGTKKKILDSALELFNDTNTQAATTNHIAAAAGISPGNLHYHFKNREAIIRKLYEQMRGEFTLLPEEYPKTTQELVKVHEKVFEIQLKYRFFYRELLFLLSRDSELKAQYEKDVKAQKQRIIVILEQLQSCGVIALSTGCADYLSDMILLIEQFWSSYMQLCEHNGSVVDIARGIERIEQTLAPYLKKPLE